MRIWSSIPKRKDVKAWFEYILYCGLDFSNLIGGGCDVILVDHYRGKLMPWEIHLGILPRSESAYDHLALNWHQWTAETFPHRSHKLSQAEKDICAQIQALSLEIGKVSMRGLFSGLAELNGFDSEPGSESCEFESLRRKKDLVAQIRRLEGEMESVKLSEDHPDYFDRFDRSTDLLGMARVYIDLLDWDKAVRRRGLDCFIPKKKSKGFRKTKHPDRHAGKILIFSKK